MIEATITDDNGIYNTSLIKIVFFKIELDIQLVVIWQFFGTSIRKQYLWKYVKTIYVKSVFKLNIMCS